MDFLEQLEAIRRPAIRQHPWMKDKVMERVTRERLPSVIDDCIASRLYALDLETTGLDNRVFLNATRDQIVGACLSPDGIHGYYVPVMHPGHMDKCVPLSEFMAQMRRLVASPAVAIFHNAKFDQEFLQFNGSGEPIGEWDDPNKWEDTLILAYLRNTREKNKGLKHLSSTMLGMEMIELSSLFTSEELKDGLDFGRLDPTWEPAIWYGASDAICTYLLHQRLKEEALEPTAAGLPSQKTIYKVEKLCVAATRWMERNRIPIDRDKVIELIRVGQREWLPALQEVYTETSKVLGRDITPAAVRLLAGDGPHRFNPENTDVGITGALHIARDAADRDPHLRDPTEVDDRGKVRVKTIPKQVPYLAKKNEAAKKGVETVHFPVVYDIPIAEQLGMLLRELGVPGLMMTDKSGQVQTSKDELDRVLEEAGEDFPYLIKVKQFREVTKAIGTNLIPILEATQPGHVCPDGRIRINFEAFKVDTGRFSISKDSERRAFTGKARWNIHSIPATYKTDIPECMIRIREVIRAEPGRKIYAIDYSGQELRVVTNLSGEPLWVKEFFRCAACGHDFPRGEKVPPPPAAPPPFCPDCGSDKIGDLHTLTAISIFGPDVMLTPEGKQRRNESKCVHPDTIIHTDMGPCRVGVLPSVSGQFLPVTGRSVWDGAAQVPLLETYGGGRKHLHHIITRRGVLTCTAEHRVELADGMLSSITTGLRRGVLLPEPSPDKTCLPDRPWPIISHRVFAGVPHVQILTNKHLAYVAGLVLGDGTKSPSCCKITHGDVGKTDKMGVPYADWQRVIMDACIKADLEPTPFMDHVYLGSRHLIRYMAALQIYTLPEETNGTRRFRIPDWVWAAGREALMHFLGGLFDTDGCVSAKDKSLSVTMKDPVFAGHVAAALQVLGMQASFETCWNKTYKRWYYRVKVFREDSVLFTPYMRHPGKVARLQSASLRARCGRRKPNEVLLVLDAGEQDCVDLHVGSNDHLYWANGFRSHNSVNFALCYGGGGMAVVRAAGVTREEGQRIKRQFDGTYKGLAGWWGRQHEFARRTKHVLTAFNRRYPLPDIDSADGGFRSKAERNAVNGPIQGCLHPDGRVPTDEGMLRVEDLYKRAADGGPVRFNVWTGKGWAEAQPLLSGPKRLHETTLEDGGTLLTSPEHLFRVWDSKQRSFVWVRQHDLVEGDWVARDPSALELRAPTYTFSDKGRSHNAHGFSFDGNHPVLWELLGRLVGDGSLREDGLIVHVGEAPAALASEATACGYSAEGHARDLASRVSVALGLDVKVVEKPRDEEDTRRNTWQVQVWNSAFVRFCVDVLGLKIASCLQKEFPTAVWKESIAHRAAFLRGYMDADGGITPNLDLVGLRSASPKLLREAYLLFRSVGVRASCRLHSQFVSVLDRRAFREVVGFGVSYKAARLAKMKVNPQTDRNTRLPSDVVQMIGRALRDCVGYASLPRARKSAVLRLMTGSGSKAQCLRLASECGVLWLGEHLEPALAYDYSRVVSKRDTGETVTMYDVEVFDDDHAFACDGVIVHNTGADLMKYAMGLIYRECKQRGWLDKVRMIITIHDELVFEIDDDVAEIAIPVISDLMLKKTIEKLAWRVPLTCDIECGFDWTVPWHLTKILAGKKPLPKELTEIFRTAAVTKDVDQAPPDQAPPDAVPVTSSSPPQQPVAPGAPFVYVLHSSSLTMLSQRRLAMVIHRCRGRGSNPLRIVNERNESLWDGDDILVNPLEFNVALNLPDGG